MQTEKVVIERKRRWADSRYSVGIYIDGEFVVNTIENNRQEIELSVGKHLLKVEQGNRSGEIEIEVKKGKVLTCIFRSGSLRTLIYAIGIATVIISEGFEVRGGYSLLLLLPTLLLFLYSFTIGRKSYFVFEQPTEDYSWINN